MKEASSAKAEIARTWLSPSERATLAAGKWQTTVLYLMVIVGLLASPAFAQSQRRDNPTARETLRWMQTTLESGAGDYEVYHEVRSVRLDDFVGCKVHFSYSDHQEPYANGEPAPHSNRKYRIDYFFSLGDIDPTNITFSKGLGLRADNKGVYEIPSFFTIRTRNDEKKITTTLFGEPATGSKPDDTFVTFAVEGEDDYVVRFAKAFKHAVEACGGKPSLFADSHGQGSDERAPLAAGGVAAQSAPPRKGTQDPWAVVSQVPVVAMRSAPPRKDIPTIAKAASGAIVSIIMSDKDGNPIAQGSGFFVSKDGLILTNYHVIAKGTSAVVKLPDGAFYVVDGVLAFDKARDVAVIKAHGENFRTLRLGNSDRVQVGQEVVAIGNPLSLESTVSNGIVSSIRTIEDEGGKYLQVTAPISPGSSGGPLFNMDGEVVGITTMYIKGGENLNFAIPINDAKHLLETLSSTVEPFPNTPEEQQETSAGTAVNAQIDSPAFKYFNDMLAAHEGDATGSTYACFNDDPAESFQLIRIWTGLDMWFVDILNVKKAAVDSILGYFHAGTLKLDANGEIDAIFSSDYLLPNGGASDVDKALHKEDYLKWGPHTISFQWLSYQPPANVAMGYMVTSFTMGRPSGKYVTTHTPVGVGSSSLDTMSETGQCVRVPGSKTLEEKLQGSSQ